MFRLYFVVFWGKNTEYEHAPHESPATMTIPLIFLGLVSYLPVYLPFSEFVSSDSVPFSKQPAFLYRHSFDNNRLLVGIFAAVDIVQERNRICQQKLIDGCVVPIPTIYNKFYIDEIYMFVTKKIIFNGISQSIAWFDRHIVDGTMTALQEH